MENTKKNAVKKVATYATTGVALSYVAYKVIDYIQYRKLEREYGQDENIITDEEYIQDNYTLKSEPKKKMKKISSPFSKTR